jgi:hypothetical protein
MRHLAPPPPYVNPTVAPSAKIESYRSAVSTWQPERKRTGLLGPILLVVLVVGVLVWLGTSLERSQPTPARPVPAQARIDPTDEVPSYSIFERHGSLDVDARLTNVEIGRRRIGSFEEIRLTASIAPVAVKRMKVVAYFVDDSDVVAPQYSTDNTNSISRGTACWVTFPENDGPAPRIVDVPLSMYIAARRTPPTGFNSGAMHVVVFDSSDRILSNFIRQLPPVE